jgi:hypothetical protein
MGNQFIRMIDGKQVLVSFHGIQQAPFIHGEVVASNGDRYLVRSAHGNGVVEGYVAPIGDYARPMPAKLAANWISIWEREAA